MLRKSWGHWQSDELNLAKLLIFLGFVAVHAVSQFFFGSCFFFGLAIVDHGWCLAVVACFVWLLAADAVSCLAVVTLFLLLLFIIASDVRY